MSNITDEKFKEFLKEYYDNVNDAVIIYDTFADTYTYCNKKVEEIFEISREEFMDMSHRVRIYSFVHVDDIYRFLRFQMINDTGDAIYRIVTGTAKIKWVHVRFYRKKISQRSCVYAIIEDITKTMKDLKPVIKRRTINN
jgi:PAS domain-containing protein